MGIVRTLLKELSAVLPCLLLALFFVSFLFDSEMKKKEINRELVAISPLAFFKRGGLLIDPKNLNFLAEYYLLENLSAGLVYENWHNVEAWEPRLAESWKKISDTEWEFQLRKDIYWSDGTPIDPSDILKHFERLRKENSRHISILKTAKSIKLDVERNCIVFGFSIPIADGFLHELSLSESGILHPKNLLGDWAVTSGAYSVETKSAQEITLTANPYFIVPASITKISIHPAPYLNVDVRKRPAFSFRKEIEDIFALSKVINRGYPTLVYYFYFNPKNPLIRDSKTRKAFAYFIKNTFQKFSYKDILTENNQLIPKGYGGRLKDTPIFSNVGLKLLEKQTLIIELNECFTTLFPEILEAEANKHKIKLKLLFDSPSDPEEPFAVFANFVGNQRDPLSSWRYLYGEGGPLHPFYPKVQHLFDAITSANESERKELLLELHRITLEEAYAVPFVAEYDAILASDRVDLSGINPFDMRLRFFEMKWKK